jgi:hypothetical protein
MAQSKNSAQDFADSLYGCAPARDASARACAVRLRDPGDRARARA